MNASLDSTATVSDSFRENGIPSNQLVESADPFDPARLRLSQDFAATVGVQKLLLSVPVRKPDKSWFIQVHPDKSYQIQTAVIELKDEREVYLIDRSLWPALSAESTFGPRAIFTAINRHGNVFLWPIRLPGPDGKIDEWSQSAFEAAKIAEGNWCRVVANMGIGAYEVHKAAGNLGAPIWPDMPLSELLRIGFRGRFVDSLDHPVLQKLRGES